MQNGTYNYFLNGEPTGVFETFEINLLPDGTKFTQSIRDARLYKTTIKVKTISENDKYHICKFIYENNKNKIEANYEFSDESFHILRKLNGEIVQNETAKLPNNAIIFPLMRCFQGQTILQVAERVQVTTVFVPDIQSITENENLLKPTFDERTAKLISTNNNLRIYNYLSEHYADNSEFHLDENGLLVYYKFVQNESQTWEIRL